MVVAITGWLLVLLGASLAAGGVWLAAIGGSWAYIVLGAGLVITGVLLSRRRAAALGVYAAVLVATLAWALWEVGLDRWALVPRGALLALLGLWLLTPWIGRFSWRGARGALGIAMLLVIATTVISLFTDPVD